MAKKKRGKAGSKKAGPKTVKKKKPSAKKKASKAKQAKPKKTLPKRAAKPAATAKVTEHDVREEIEDRSEQLFVQKEHMTFKIWMTRYSPVIITMIVGLATYFFLVFYLFYPQTLLYGHYIQLLMLLMFIFFVIGVLIYLGVQAELMFIRIMSFAFVFIIFTFLLIFILLAHSMYG